MQTLNFDEVLDKYADVSLGIGLNLQKGQTLYISAPIESVTFVRKVVAKAYDLGALRVYVDWNDEQVSAIWYEKAPFESFEIYPDWSALKFNQLAEQGAAFLFVEGRDPDLLQNVDPKRISTSQRVSGEKLKPFRELEQNMKVSWLIVAVPTQAWAAKVFPALSPEEQVQKLWEYILKSSRVDGEDPLANWEEHIRTLDNHAEILNQQQFAALHYRGPGTDLRVELPQNHIWVSAGSTNAKGYTFVPNIPTEEVFCMPKRDGVNGTLLSTMPLNHNGVVIDGFSFTFENGRVVDFQAERGYETLQEILELDEAARYLGEIALVPHDSPISNLNTLFYNTLFDENASCHFAVGSAYPICIEGGVDMDEAALLQHGANVSLQHVDFMVGGPDLDIDGITQDGHVIPVFRNGNWADR